MRRLIAFLVAFPFLIGGWGVANSIGLTAVVSEATGYDLPDNLTFPGIDKVFEASDFVGNARERAQEKVRQEAVKALRKEVRDRYGAETAALIPNDLSAGEARRILGEVVGGADTSDLRALLDGAPTPGGPKPGSGNGGGDNGGGGGGKPQDIPYMNAKAYATALETLPTLAVKGRAPMTGYDRDEYGSEWSDSAGDFFWTDNGCDTRDDALKRDLVKKTFESGSTCEVETGVLPYEPYSGQRDYRFVKGGSMDVSLDAEHIVALANSWVTGAQQWSEAKRAAFANDPLNVMMASATLNRAKSDADFATWLPPNKAYRCAYASRQIAIKAKYGLWVTPAEKAAMQKVLDGCA